MLDIGEAVYGIFGPYGAIGLLICIFLIFIIDALIFPTLPEVFTVIAYMYNPSPEWALAILFTLLLGELVGMTTLYLIVERISVPKRVSSIATRYINFLIVGDERLLFINRFAPMVPFCGAFVSIIDSWSYRRALVFLLSGALLKYSLILAMSGFFFRFFSGPEAQLYTMVFVFSFIALSFIYSSYRKRKYRPACRLDAD